MWLGEVAAEAEGIGVTDRGAERDDRPETRESLMQEAREAFFGRCEKCGYPYPPTIATFAAHVCSGAAAGEPADPLIGGEGPAIPASQYYAALHGAGCVEIPNRDGSDMLIYDITDPPSVAALIAELAERLALRGRAPEGQRTPDHE